MKKLTFLITALFLFFPLLIRAQTDKIEITGIVYDAENGETLPGANIYIPDTQKGASTDAEGRYSIKMEPGTYRLVASFVGFKTDTVTITVKPGEDNRHDFYMQPDVIEGEEILVYSDRLERRVRELADLRNEERSSLENYSVSVHKLGLVYETGSGQSGGEVTSDSDSTGFNTDDTLSSSVKSSIRASGYTRSDAADAIAYAERNVEQYYVAPKTFGERYLARRSSDNFFSEYEVFSTGGNPLDLNEDEVVLNILSEDVSVVGPISKKAPEFYNLSDELADSTWPEGTTEIIVEPKNQRRPLFKGSVFVDNETDKVVGMDLKMNEAGEVFTGVYSLSDFKYFQKFKKVEDYWLPSRTEIEGKIGIIGIKNDFIYRDLWSYNDYRINRDDLGKEDIPLSGIEIAQNADNRDVEYWNELTGNNVREEDARELEEAMNYEEDRFLVNFLMASFRTYYNVPNFLRTKYFTNVSDFYRLNRVEGNYVGAGLRTPAVIDDYTYKGAIGYATEANDLRYYLEALQFLPGTPLALEGSFYNKLAIQFGDYRYQVGPLNVDEFRYTLQTAFSGFDPRNYFEREGFSLGLRWQFRPKFFLRANYMREDQRFLPIVAPHSLFSSFEIGSEQIDPNLNPRVGETPDGTIGPDGLEGFTEGEFAGFEFQFHFDNRQYRQNGIFRNYLIRNFGWFTDHLVYWSDPSFGGNETDIFEHLKYRSSVGVRVPLFASHFLLSEFFVGGSDNPLPAQRQLGSNGFYVEDFVRRRPFLTLGFNEGIGNRVTAARIDYDLGSGFVRMIPIRFIRQSGMQLRVYGAAGYRHSEANLRPVTPWTEGMQEHVEVGFSLTRIVGVFSIDIGLRIEGDAGDKVGLSVII